ncbi:Oidioi.mRNA.OKI2018_I69.chr2.g5092.t1.cds [Oikopleura dioica]|uniref:Oidioi.mRNA.OKI2018_I69.chr2.g5092.t1.cds n=1 Tax=Oikopleura dioica TaxID=34765 RepID=A0ABN7T604_OIKDI|nr:Oidioi.mRNA.OKI2018_I69.chr2.g5092.t1.cds [Oikopleura dioica]
MGKSKKKAAKRNSPIDQFEVIDNSQLEQFQSKCRFRKSCIQGDFDAARKMIEENPSIERIVDKSGWNGLHHAAAEGHFPIVELCIRSNFKINARTKEDETALLLASRNGHQHVVDYLIKENADVFAISKSGQNALSEAARKNRPLITSLLQDALQTPLASSTPREEKKKNSEDFSLVGTTNSDVDYIRKQLAEAKQKLTDKNNEVTTLKSEIIELHKELDLRTEQIEHMKGHFSREAAEKEIMITEIKSDIDLVSSDVERTNALLETETNFRESLEEENRKLMDILLRREETIKRLEVRARNALEISIRADDYIKSHSSSSG